MSAKNFEIVEALYKSYINELLMKCLKAGSKKYGGNTYENDVFREELSYLERLYRKTPTIWIRELKKVLEETA